MFNDRLFGKNPLINKKTGIGSRFQKPIPALEGYFQYLLSYGISPVYQDIKYNCAKNNHGPESEGIDHSPFYKFKIFRRCRDS